MPAAAVIPAPIAYIKVVAVKKLVVELWPFAFPVVSSRMYCWTGASSSRACVLPQGVCKSLWTFTLRKLECSKQAFA